MPDQKHNQPHSGGEGEAPSDSANSSSLLRAAGDPQLDAALSRSESEKGATRTPMIEQIKADKAKALLDEDPEAIYVDVRSIPEFVRGHPIRALNIPLLHFNEQGQQMVPNPDFNRVAETVLPRDKKLIVGCMVGGRSQRACEILQQMGFQKLYNVQGGFGGTRDPMTGKPIPGWSQLGLPISEENGEGVGYESLLKKIK